MRTTDRPLTYTLPAVAKRGNPTRTTSLVTGPRDAGTEKSMYTHSHTPEDTGTPEAVALVFSSRVLAALYTSVKNMDRTPLN
jgi:hypothetical protein